MQSAPHLYCGPSVGAANIQLANCTPNFLIAEAIGKMDGFHAKLLKKPLLWEDGYLIPPKEAGLGVELDDAIVAANPYEGDALHLQMGQAPYDPVRDRLCPGG